MVTAVAAVTVVVATWAVAAVTWAAAWVDMGGGHMGARHGPTWADTVAA